MKNSDLDKVVNVFSAVLQEIRKGVRKMKKYNATVNRKDLADAFDVFMVLAVNVDPAKFWKIPGIRRRFERAVRTMDKILGKGPRRRTKYGWEAHGTKKV